MSSWKCHFQSCQCINATWTLLQEIMSFWGCHHRVLPVTTVCSAFFQKGLFGGIHHLPDPLHCAAHTAVGGPRREVFGLHCTCSRKVGQNRWCSLTLFAHQNAFVFLKWIPTLLPESFTDVQKCWVTQQFQPQIKLNKESPAFSYQLSEYNDLRDLLNFIGGLAIVSDS